MNKAEKFRFEDQIAYTENGIVSKQIVKSKTGNVTLFAFDKDQFLSEHTAPFDALIQVIEGETKVSIDGIWYELTAGESIILPANIPHAVNALSPFKMVLTMIKES